MFNVAANMKHVHSREQQLKIRECFLFVCLQCLFSIVAVFLVRRMIPCVHTLWLKFVSCSSSPCLMRTLSESLSNLSIYSLSFSSFPLASCTSFCLSPSLSVMSWTTTMRIATGELAPQDYQNASTGTITHVSNFPMRNQVLRS